jgi:hypothetical protein
MDEYDDISALLQAEAHYASAMSCYLGSTRCSHTASNTQPQPAPQPGQPPHPHAEATPPHRVAEVAKERGSSEWSQQGVKRVRLSYTKSSSIAT